MGQTLEGRAHAAALLRTLADAAEDPSVSAERLASLAMLIGRHLVDIAPPTRRSLATTSLHVIGGDRQLT